jgi:hypothetical protein
MQKRRLNGGSQKGGGGKTIAEKGVNKRLVEREGRGREMAGKRD